MVHADDVQYMGRALCEKLKTLLARQQFDVVLQVRRVSSLLPVTSRRIDGDRLYGRLIRLVMFAEMHHTA